MLVAEDLGLFVSPARPAGDEAVDGHPDDSQPGDSDVGDPYIEQKSVVARPRCGADPAASPADADGLLVPAFNGVVQQVAADTDKAQHGQRQTDDVQDAWARDIARARRRRARDASWRCDGLPRQPCQRC